MDVFLTEFLLLLQLNTAMKPGFKSTFENDSWRHLKICNFRYEKKTLKSYIRYLFHLQNPVIKGCNETLSKEELHEGSSWNIAVTVVKVGVYATWQQLKP